MNYKTLLFVLAAVLGIFLIAQIPVSTKVVPSPLGDGLDCSEMPKNVGGYMCMKRGDYSPRYYITPDGKKQTVRYWFE